MAWKSPSEGEPVYRLYNPYSGDHLYTGDRAEYDRLGSIGWNQEGVSFNAIRQSDASVQGGISIYRLFNPYVTVGTHLFTTDRAEYDHLTSLGWSGEQVAFYALPADANAVPSNQANGSSKPEQPAQQTTDTGSDEAFTEPVPFSKAYVVLYDDGELVFSGNKSTNKSTNPGRGVIASGSYSDVSKMWKNGQRVLADAEKITCKCKITADDTIRFGYCFSLSDISGLANVDTSKMTTMAFMFYGDSSLSDLSSIANWDTSSVTSMSNMFAQCTSLKDASALSNWNVSHVTDMEQMFNYTDVSAGKFPAWYTQS